MPRSSWDQEVKAVARQIEAMMKKQMIQMGPEMFEVIEAQKIMLAVEAQIDADLQTLQQIALSRMPLSDASRAVLMWTQKLSQMLSEMLTRQRRILSQSMWLALIHERLVSGAQKLLSSESHRIMDIARRRDALGKTRAFLKQRLSEIDRWRQQMQGEYQRSEIFDQNMQATRSMVVHFGPNLTSSRRHPLWIGFSDMARILVGAMKVHRLHSDPELLQRWQATEAKSAQILAKLRSQALAEPTRAGAQSADKTQVGALRWELERMQRDLCEIDGQLKSLGQPLRLMRRRYRGVDTDSVVHSASAS